MAPELQTLITALLPSPCAVRLTEVTVEQASVRLQLTATAPTAACPRCTVSSSSIHSHYQRHLTDLPWGTRAAARLSGLGWRAAAALGTLMNTRGLMELIVLNIGLDLQIISPPLFAMMVVMALVTTMATAPVLQWLLPQTASAPAPESARVTHGGQASSAARAERRQAEGPSAGHQK